MLTTSRPASIFLAAAIFFSITPSVALAVNEGEDETAEVAPAPFATEMAVLSTRYQSYGRLRGRAHNVELAAAMIDGAVLMPGEELSFNQRVGERTLERGFQYAPVIANGRVREGVGGGICQVASTLHAAAMHAGLDVVEHRPHSRPSSYIDPGLDATVAWNRIDFRVSNPHPFPVRVSAKARLGEVRVALLGAAVHEAARVEARVVWRSEAGFVVRVSHVSADGERRERRVRYPARTPTAESDPST